MTTKVDEKPRLMDQLIGEQQREANNNEVFIFYSNSPCILIK
jgi:hypothetical protein